MDPESRTQPLQGGDCERLLAEYAQSVLSLGGVYSIPTTADVILDVSGKSILEETSPPDLGEKSANSLFFRVLNTRLRRQKTIGTHDALFGAKSSATVVSVQVLKQATVKDGRSRSPGEATAVVNLYEGSVPSRVDLALLAPLPWWVRYLTSWTPMGPSPPQFYQHTAYVSQGDVEVVGDGRDTDLPMAVALIRLAARGWSAGRPGLLPHTPRDDDATRMRLCMEPGFSQSPHYAVCLLHLGDLFAAGLKELHADQQNAYYRAALKSPLIVRPFQRQQWYRALLSGRPLPHEPDVKRRRGTKPTLDAEDSYSHGLPVMALPSDVPAGSAFRPRAVVEEHGSSHLHLVGHAAEKSSDSDDSPFVANVRTLLALARKPHDELLPETPEANIPASSGIDFPEPPLLQPIVPNRSAHPLPPGVDRHPSPQRIQMLFSRRLLGIYNEATASQIPTSIEGVPIHLTCSATDDDEYVRKSVSCSELGHEGCCKSRRCTFSTNFGQLEPVGYLGCWLGGASRFATREAHMRWKPQVSEVREYLVSNVLI